MVDRRRQPDSRGKERIQYPKLERTLTRVAARSWCGIIRVRRAEA